MKRILFAAFAALLLSGGARAQGVVLDGHGKPVLTGKKQRVVSPKQKRDDQKIAFVFHPDTMLDFPNDVVPVVTCVPSQATAGMIGCQPVASSTSGGYVQMWYPAAFPNSAQIAPISLFGGALTIGTSTITGCSNSGYVLYNNAGVLGCEAGTGTGTVTSITLATPSSTLTLGGTNPVTGSGTINADLNLTHANTWSGLQTLVGTNITGLPLTTGVTGILPVANGGLGISSGTSGGVLAYTATGTLASSGALTANLPVIGGGAGVAPSVGTRSGNTTEFVTTTGAQTSGHCVSIDASGNHVDNGSACGGSGSTGANPTATAGPTAVNGSATTFLRSDGAPAIQLATSSQKGIAQVDGQSIVATSGVISTSAPNRPVTSNGGSCPTTSSTICATDMSGQVNFNGSSLTVTIPAISSTILAAGMTVAITNQNASALTISTTPTINGYSGSTIAQNTALICTSNGTSLDCFGTSAASAGAALLAANQSFTKGQAVTPFGLTDGATISVDATQSNVFTVTLAGNRTLANPTGILAGQTLSFEITQDGTGSRTLAYGTDYNWLSGSAPLLNATAAAKTTISCLADTTSTLQCAGGAPQATITTGTNCASGASPAVCGSASSGSGAVPTGTNPTLVVDTTAVTANSIILLTPDESLGTKLSVTCNTTITTQGPLVVTARSAGVSFTVEVDATVASNPTCFNFAVIN